VEYEFLKTERDPLEGVTTEQLLEVASKRLRDSTNAIASYSVDEALRQLRKAPRPRATCEPDVAVGG
jgi:hypothetical protein